MQKTTTHPPHPPARRRAPLPKSLRKFIRREKARIRREVLELKEQERQIQELYQKIFEKIKTKNEIKV